MSVYPNNRITLNLTTVNAVRPLRGRYYLRIHTASSASLHMRLSYVGRLRRPAKHCCHPKSSRMNPYRKSSQAKGLRLSPQGNIRKQPQPTTATICKSKHFTLSGLKIRRFLLALQKQEAPQQPLETHGLTRAGIRRDAPRPVLIFFSPKKLPVQKTMATFAAGY